MIERLIDQAKEKLKGKEGKEALKFLKEHKDELETLGKDALSRMFAWVAQGEPEKAKDLYLIQYQLPDELIHGMEESGRIFEEAHRQMEEEAKRISDMWKKLGEEAARKLLPILITSL